MEMKFIVSFVPIFVIAPIVLIPLALRSTTIVVLGDVVPLEWHYKWPRNNRLAAYSSHFVQKDGLDSQNENEQVQSRPP
jgi:hypothetical protein